MKYIDAEKLRAEIERLKKDAWDSILPDEPKYRTHYKVGRKEVCDDLLSFLDTLQEPEVDLEKEIDSYINSSFSEAHDGVLISDANSSEVTYQDMAAIARHFFELGRKAK